MTETREEAITRLTNQANIAHEYKIQIYDTDKRCHDVRWLDNDKQQVGYGYIVKDEAGKYIPHINVIRCPACRLENYALNVTSGFCTWCPFEANKTLNNKESNNE